MFKNERSTRISRLLQDQGSRASYIKAKLGVLVPAQIRALRLKSNMPRQRDLAREADMQQSRISMFESPGSANLTLDTLSRLAATFKTGLVIKFVPFSEMLRWENEFSQDTFDVLRLDADDAFVNPAETRTSRGAMAAAAGIGVNSLAGERKPPAAVQEIGDSHIAPPAVGMAGAAFQQSYLSAAEIGELNRAG